MTYGKQIVLILTMMQMLVACDRHNVQPLIHSLVTYTDKDDSGEWCLKGVKDAEADMVVVPPGRYQCITADSRFITCTKLEDDVEMQWVYQLNGDFVGQFEHFTHWTAGCDYYLGVNYTQRFYYFPKTDTHVWASQIYEDEEADSILFMLVDDEWKAYTYNGDQLNYPLPDAEVIHNAKNPNL